MTQTDRRRFSQMVVALAEGLGEPLSDARLQFYFTALCDHSIEQVERAAVTLTKTSRFFPKPVDFIEVIQGSPDDRATQAWLLLCEAVFKIGYPRSLFVEDRATAFALEHTFGGWIQCNEQLAPMVPSDPMFASLRRTFMQNFQLCNRDKSLQPSQRYFPSSCEAMNRENVSQWQDRPWPLLEDGTPVFTQKVGVIRGGQVSEMEAVYSATTGALTDGSKRKLLGQPEPQRQLTAAD